MGSKHIDISVVELMHLKIKNRKNSQDCRPTDVGLTGVLLSAQFSSARCRLRSCPARRWRHCDMEQCEPDKCFVDVRVGDA